MSDDDETSNVSFASDDEESESPQPVFQPSLCLTKCNVYVYKCSAYSCELRFPAAGFDVGGFWRHLADRHLDFRSYKCYAVESVLSHHPSAYQKNPWFWKTVMTDAMVDIHRESALRVTRNLRGSPRIFPYLETACATDCGATFFTCCHCGATSTSLDIYRCHVVHKHVKVIISPLQSFMRHSKFPIFGSPVSVCRR